MRKKSLEEEAVLNKIDEAYFKSNGLTSQQVKELTKLGLVNKIKENFKQSYWMIVLKNLFNWFNIILFGLAIVFLCFQVGFNGSEYGITKYGFLLPVFFNLIIGLIQECKAKHTVDKLKILNVPKVKVIRDGKEMEIQQEEVVLNDLVVVERGLQVPVDGFVLDGYLSLNESLLTGEQNEKKHGVGDKILAGTIVETGRALIKTTAVGDNTYSACLRKNLVKQKKPKSEMVNGVHILVIALSILVVPFAAVTGYTAYQNFAQGNSLSTLQNNISQEIAVEVGTTIIGAIPTGLVLITSARCALSIISLYKKNVSIKELSAVEGLAFSNFVCLDKTGTITTETMNLESIDFLDNEPNHVKTYLSAVLKNVPDNSETINAIRRFIHLPIALEVKEVLPFSSKNKFSGCYFKDSPDSFYGLGAPQFLLPVGSPLLAKVKEEASKGIRVLAFVIKNRKTDQVQPLALIKLKDEIRPNAEKALKALVDAGVQVKIISGDDPFTVSSIAHRLNVPGWEKIVNMRELPKDADLKKLVFENVIFGRTTPDQKRDLIQALNATGNKVTMVIDGLNDLLAAKAANCSICIAHKSGASAATQIADVTILDGDFGHLPEIIKEGRKSVNGMERSATLFLMKSFMALGLAAFSPIFKHLPYSIEGLYVVTGFIIGLGGMILGLEDSNEPLKGHFLKVVLSRSIPPGLFMFIPVICVQFMTLSNALPYALGVARFGNATSAIQGQAFSFSQFNSQILTVTSEGTEARNLFLKSVVVIEEPLCILTACIASLGVMTRTCMPLNKFRLMTLGIVFGIAILSILSLPNLFLGMDYIPEDYRWKFIWLFSKDSSVYYLGGYPLAYSWLLVFLLLTVPFYSLCRNLSDYFVFHTTDKFEKIFQIVDLKTDQSIADSIHLFDDD